MKSYCQVDNYRLASFKTNDTIAEADMDIINFKQPTGREKSNTSSNFGQKSYNAGGSTMKMVIQENLSRNWNRCSDRASQSIRLRKSGVGTTTGTRLPRNVPRQPAVGQHNTEVGYSKSITERPGHLEWLHQHESTVHLNLWEPSRLCHQNSTPATAATSLFKNIDGGIRPVISRPDVYYRNGSDELLEGVSGPGRSDIRMSEYQQPGNIHLQLRLKFPLPTKRMHVQHNVWKTQVRNSRFS